MPVIGIKASYPPQRGAHSLHSSRASPGSNRNLARSTGATDHRHDHHQENLSVCLHSSPLLLLLSSLPRRGEHQRCRRTRRSWRRRSLLRDVGGPGIEQIERSFLLPKLHGARRSVDLRLEKVRANQIRNLALCLLHQSKEKERVQSERFKKNRTYQGEGRKLKRRITDQEKRHLYRRSPGWPPLKDLYRYVCLALPVEYRSSPKFSFCLGYIQHGRESERARERSRQIDKRRPQLLLPLLRRVQA